MASCPKLYYDWLANAEVIDILDIHNHNLSGRSVILGGGGLFHPPFEPFLQYILDSDTKHLVLWGVGRNAHDINDVLIRPPCGKDLIAKADLVGIRDSVIEEEWCPCPSVMNPIFKNNWGNEYQEPEHDKVVLLHTQRDLEVWDQPYKNLHMRMDQPMNVILNFILKGKTVLSSSYHGCLWAEWLNREVIVGNPFSQKFTWGLGSTFQDAFTRSEIFAEEVESLLYHSQ